MKKIFWRVFVAFGVVLLVFTILIGLMFTRFNRTNIVGAYKQQLGGFGRWRCHSDKSGSKRP
ncbi:MAG: hypothetical protein ACLU22_03065 [Clostridium sp.]